MKRKTLQYKVPPTLSPYFQMAKQSHNYWVSIETTQCKTPSNFRFKRRKKKKDPDVLNDGEVKIEVRRGRVRRQSHVILLCRRTSLQNTYFLVIRIGDINLRKEIIFSPVVQKDLISPASLDIMTWADIISLFLGNIEEKKKSLPPSQSLLELLEISIPQKQKFYASLKLYKISPFILNS